MARPHIPFRLPSISAKGAASLTAAVLLTLALSSTALAQSAPAAPLTDRMDLVALTTRQPSPDSPPNQVQFRATVNYRLTSNDSGFVLLFLFENSSTDSSQESSNGIAVQRGTGQMVLDIDYTLKPGVRSLTLVAGLFKTESKMLAWVSTNPIDMAPWPGRVAFEKAMADRLNNDLTDANQELSQAIEESPGTGNYYYWRGDTRVRLNQFDDAIADFSQSIQLMPQDRASRVGRGVAELWQGTPQAAVDDLSAVIGADATPDRITAWAYRARGLANASLGQSDAAKADYQQYLALSPTASDRDQIEAWIAALS